MAMAVSLLTFGGGCGNGPFCAECRNEKCSDVAAYCNEEVGCRCMSRCLGREGVPGIEACLGTCGLSERPPAFLHVEECVAAACPDSEDECSTPPGYVPPDPTVPTTTADIGGGDMPDCGFDRALPFDPAGTVLQLETADGRVCARIERRAEGEGRLANTSYALVDVRVGPLGMVARDGAGAASCYYSSHHNFADWVHFWTGRRRHDLKLERFGEDGAWSFELHSFEQGPIGECAPLPDGTSPVGEPLALLPVRP
jgi:hypothetical protein